MKKIIWSLFAAITLFGANAITCCAPLQTVQEAYNSEKAVYTGYVQSISTEPDPNEPRGIKRFVVKTIVKQNWKGLSRQKELFLRTGTECGYNFRIGETYLIYGYASRDGVLSTNCCSRTMHMSEANADIKELNEIVGQVH